MWLDGCRVVDLICSVDFGGGLVCWSSLDCGGKLGEGGIRVFRLETRKMA